MLSLSIAGRFLRSAPGQTALIIAGIGVGIAVQIFVGSLISSLQDDLVQSTVGSSPHITLLPDDAEQLSASLVDDASGQPEVTTAIPVRRMSGLFVDGDESTPLSVVGVAVGDDLELVLPNGAVAAYTVAGTFDLGAAAANDRLAFLDPNAVAEALGLSDDEYSAIEIQVADVFTSTEVGERLRSPGVEVVDWQAENEELLSGLAAQSGSSLMIQAFVLVAVALGIASTLAISAVQKTRQIGILKAMGMTDAAAGRIFLLQALILGVAGVAAGIGLGYLLIWGFSFAPVDFSVRPSPALIAVSAAIGVAVALASSVIPSRSTSRVDPIEVIQGG